MRSLHIGSWYSMREDICYWYPQNPWIELIQFYELTQISLLFIRMNQEFKSSTGIFSVLKKTRATNNGDSSGQKELKKCDSDKKYYHVDSLSMYNSKRRIQFSETKLSLFNPHHKPSRLPKKPHTNPQRRQPQNDTHEKQATVDEILSKSLRLTKDCFKNQQITTEKPLTVTNKQKLSQFNKVFKDCIIKIVREIKYKPKQLACHLNTVYFSRENVRFWEISEIQKQIFKQWKENVLLRSIRHEWMVLLQQFLPKFEDQGFLIFSEIIYENFCFLMSHLTYVIFQSYYTFKLQKDSDKKEEFIERLNRRTMRYVVTQSPEWQNFIYLFIDEIIKNQMNCRKLSEQNRAKITEEIIEQMKIKPIRDLLEAAYIKKQTLFPETQKALARFLREHYMPNKIKFITGIRVALEQDIIVYQKTLIQQGKMQNIQMLQKDPLITCLILAVLSSGIELEGIDLALREVQLILGPDLYQILEIQRCPSYYADLIAVVEQLNEEIKKEGQCNQVSI